MFRTYLFAVLLLFIGTSLLSSTDSHARKAVYSNTSAATVTTPKLKIAAIKHYNDEFIEDPEITYPVAIEKTRQAMADYPGLHTVLLPEHTLALKHNVTTQPGANFHSYPAVEINCPAQGGPCTAVPVEAWNWFCFGPSCSTAPLPGNEISIPVVDAITEFQNLASQHGIPIILGTIKERIDKPASATTIPGNYLHFSSVVFIDENGDITGIQRKVENGEMHCQSLLQPGQWFNTVGPNHPANVCLADYNDFAFNTMEARTITLEDGTDASYFLILCVDVFRGELMQRARAAGIQNLDILMDSMAEDNFKIQEYMEAIQSGAWDEYVLNWSGHQGTGGSANNYGIIPTFIDPFVNQYEIIKKGGYLVVADSALSHGAAFQLNTPPVPLESYAITEDYVYAEVPVIHETKILSAGVIPAGAGIVEVNHNLSGNMNESPGGSPVTTEFLEIPFHYRGEFTREMRISIKGWPNQGSPFSKWVSEDGIQAVEDVYNCQTTLGLPADKSVSAFFLYDTANAAPVFDNLTNQTIEVPSVPTNVNFVVKAVDKDCYPSRVTYRAENVPSGATLDPDTGYFELPGWDGGSATFSNINFIASDGNLEVAKAIDLTIVEVNTPPNFYRLYNRTVSTGQALSFLVKADDIDGDPLTFSAANLPARATFTPDPVRSETYVFSWTPSAAQLGNHDMTFTVTDGMNPVSQTITLTVVP